MANEKDVFEVRGPCSANREWPDIPFFVVVNRETQEVTAQWEDHNDLEENLNEAFRLGYRAALMEKA